jgi:hypothetical protein
MLSSAQSARLPYKERTHSSQVTTQARKTGPCSRRSSRRANSTKLNRTAILPESSLPSSTAINRRTSVSCDRGILQPEATLTIYPTRRDLKQPPGQRRYPTNMAGSKRISSPGIGRIVFFALNAGALSRRQLGRSLLESLNLIFRDDPSSTSGCAA